MAITPQELPGHAVLEARAAAAESRQPFPLYSQVSLRGCHQSLMPSYRLPQKICQLNSLDEFGMISPQSASSTSAELNSLPFWSIDEEITSALPGCSWGTQLPTKMEYQRLEGLCNLRKAH